MSINRVRVFVSLLCATVSCVGFSPSAFGQVCDNTHIILKAEDDNNVSLIEHASMNEDGTVVIGVRQLPQDPFEKESITRILEWSLNDPKDPTQNVMVEDDDADEDSPYTFVAQPTINAFGDVVFIANRPGEGRNIFRFTPDGEDVPLLDFLTGPPRAARLRCSMMIRIHGLCTGN